MNKDEMIKDSEHKETRFEAMTHFDEPSIPHSFVIPSYDFGGDVEMNKDEMTKDMVADYKCCYMCQNFYYNEDGSSTCIHHNPPEKCECMYIAEALYDANCRIIADDEIVLKKDEYELTNEVLEKVIRQRNAFFVKYEQAKKEMREILDKVDYESNGQTKQITDLLRKQYDIGVEYDRH